MKLNTTLFGEIGVDESNIITFRDGIIGFPDLKHFILVHDEESENRFISWLQSIEEPGYALPVISPLSVDETYNPVIEDALLEAIEPYKTEDLAVLTTIRVTPKIEEMSSNFRGPIIINANNRRACQVIVEDETYPIRYPVYEALKKKKERAGE